MIFYPANRNLNCFILLLILVVTQTAYGIKLSGKVSDNKHQSLPFASVYIKGTTTGTATNADGYYTLELAPGNYELIFSFIGFKSHSEKITINTTPVFLDVILETQDLKLKELTVTANAEDPGYAIIRKAQKMRKTYLEQVDAYSCDVYIKGLQRITKKPQKIMGMEVDPEAEIDSTSGIFYLSESVSKFNYMKPKKIKEEMISSKVSGDNKAFSYNQASDMLFNFYENLLDLDQLSERGFVSPISVSAMLYYHFRLDGSYLEDGKFIHKIEVIPIRKSDPVFRGYIYIQDDTWRIHSADLYLTKDANIDFVDTLRVEQNFISVDAETWLPFTNRLLFVFSVLGIHGNGYFVGVNANYHLHPVFPKGFFGDEVMHVNDDANKKDSAYWAGTRPVPLSVEEENDYHKRDSLSKIRNSKPFMDSLDHKNNKISFGKIFISGYTISQRFKKQNWTISPLISNIQYNTVEGFNLKLTIAYDKEFEKKKYLYANVTPSYGFSNTHFNLFGNIYYSYKRSRFAWVSSQVGTEVEQFNEDAPISPLINSLYTLFQGYNYAKFLEKRLFRISQGMEVKNGVNYIASAEISERLPLNNTSDFTLHKSREFTSNVPMNVIDSVGVQNRDNLVLIGLRINFRFKQKYYTRPYEKFIIGSKWPTLFVQGKKAIAVFNAFDPDYTFLRVGVEDDMKFGLFGSAHYLVTAGKYLQQKNLSFADFCHFRGNQTLFSNFLMRNFNLLDYYKFSTNDEFLEGHFEHHFGGFILNKIPLMRKLRLSEVFGFHFLHTSMLPNYLEFSAGVEKLQAIRIDFVSSFSSRQHLSAGIRFGLKANFN